MKDNYIRDVKTQASGAVVHNINLKRFSTLQKALDEIELKEFFGNQIVDQRLNEAQAYVDVVRDFVGSPENILGSELTKHGEIAEQFDVYIKNARDVLEGFDPVATFEGVGRTAPEDYIVNGIKVQSKYINGASNSLSHVLEHLGKYESIQFGRDGSYYVIPKDQHALIEKVLSGDTDGLSDKTVRSILKKVSEIEKKTGRSFSDAVRPGLADYAEIQQGSIHKTLDHESENLNHRAAEQKEQISQESDENRAIAKDHAKPSLGEAVETAGTAAIVAGGMQLAVGIYQKLKEGKELHDFTENDWKDIGIDTGKAAATGGIQGLALYGMTNVLKMPAPLASGYVSSAIGVSKMAWDYRHGKLSKDEFIVDSQVLCINSAVSILGATIGTIAIPIPILGSIIGSVVAAQLSSISEKYFDKREQELICALRSSNEKYVERLTGIYNKKFSEIQAGLHSFKSLEEAAFDVSLNAPERFLNSAAFAESVGVAMPLTTIEECDGFFLE